MAAEFFEVISWENEHIQPQDAQENPPSSGAGNAELGQARGGDFVFVAFFDAFIPDFLLCLCCLFSSAPSKLVLRGKRKKEAETPRLCSSKSTNKQQNKTNQKNLLH